MRPNVCNQSKSNQSISLQDSTLNVTIKPTCWLSLGQMSLWQVLWCRFECWHASDLMQLFHLLIIIIFVKKKLGMLTDLNCIIKNDLFYFIREKFKFIIFVQLGLSSQNIPLDTVTSINLAEDCNLFLLYWF